MKIQFKGCQRCGGDLLPDGSDRERPGYVCLQCGVEVPYARVVLRRLQTLRAHATPAHAA